jgi:hypothetical protein
VTKWYIASLQVSHSGLYFNPILDYSISLKSSHYSNFMVDWKGALQDTSPP